jgi:hypothetical protein
MEQSNIDLLFKLRFDTYAALFTSDHRIGLAKKSQRDLIARLYNHGCSEHKSNVRFLMKENHPQYLQFFSKGWLDLCNEGCAAAC